MPAMHERDLAEAQDLLMQLNNERGFFDDITALQGDIERRKGARVRIDYPDGTIVDCTDLPGDFEEHLLEARAEEHRKAMETLRRTLGAIGVKTDD